jgi:type VI secretion system secreted protein VgrG
MSLTQAHRFIAVHTPLGDDALIVRSASCTEQISSLFQLELDLISSDGEIEFEQLIGESCTLRVDVAKDQTRFFNGIINRFVQTKNDGSYAHYRATVVPWLWLLTRTSDCRIFQKKSVPDIIEEVFKGHGLDSYRLALSGSYQPWDYCVQYRETDFNFVSRLMEQEGIYYFFEHEDGKHKLVLADSSSAHETYSGYETIIYRPPSDTQPLDRECVTDWVVEKELKTGAYALNDFNFETPKASLLAKSVIQRPHAAADFEVYDFPGEYEAHGDGETLAKVRIEELQSTYETLHAQASARGVCPGYLFTLQDHPRENQNREYLITGMSCQMEAGDFESGAASQEDEHFSCSFTCIDSQTPYRPARTTPKPLIQGPQTAMVVGPGGEEIHTDEHGRVIVQFPWDRYGKGNENSSCWVRVSQIWAGKSWGSIHIPRIGQEVIVEFLEGDPDRPIITGRVYNGEARAPYPLPADKTQSGIKSRSSKGGGDDNFNELRFEDKKGAEEIYIQAEKDKKVLVKNDRTEEVKHDESITIGHDRGETVGNDETISIGNNRSEDVTKNETISIGEKRSTTVGKDDELSVGDNHTITVDKKQNISVGKDQTIEVTENRKKTVGKNEQVTISGDRQEDVAKNSKIKVGKALAIEAGDEISLITGDASITMKKDGTIQLKGKDITLEGSGKINIKASSDITMKGSKVTQN